MKRITRYIAILCSVAGVLLLASCSPKVSSLIPNYTMCCKKIASKSLVDEMDMAKSPMGIEKYYRSNPRIKRIEYEQSNQADADGVCVKYERRYTAKAKSGYLYVNKTIADSLPQYHHFRYSVDGKIITRKNYSKLLNLKKRQVKAINGDPQNNIIRIRTK